MPGYISAQCLLLTPPPVTSVSQKNEEQNKTYDLTVLNNKLTTIFKRVMK